MLTGHLITHILTFFMSTKSVVVAGLLAFFYCFIVAASDHSLEDGRRIYQDGILPSGEFISATIQGDIQVTGEQVICGACHRRSGMGSMEGQQVVPAVTGNLLFKPMQIPTSKPPAAPILRPAYTRESLKLAIRTGLDAKGQLLDPIMPRYPLDDESLDKLIDYLTTLSEEFSPGVDDKEIHFATIVSEGIDATEKKALLDVMLEYFKQKNTETRHESFRAENAPWHKDWIFKPYRKWVLHIWDLRGGRETWPAQLAELYQSNPVFAVLNGKVTGDWRPIHEFCNKERIPCLFPTTDLPVIADDDFYSLYLDKGMTLEGEGVAGHLTEDGLSNGEIVQFYQDDDKYAETAAVGLRSAMLDATEKVIDYRLSSTDQLSQALAGITNRSIMVVWGDHKLLDRLLSSVTEDRLPKRIYLSTTLYGEKDLGLPPALRERIYFIHPMELPDKLNRLIVRSTGWFKAKRIYVPSAKEVQANAYFALKAVGDSLKQIRGYFYRDYFIEKIEKMIDNAPYTSVYPRISLAPGQRFVSKGYYMAQFSSDENHRLEAITDWRSHK